MRFKVNNNILKTMVRKQNISLFLIKKSPMLMKKHVKRIKMPNIPIIENKVIKEDKKIEIVNIEENNIKVDNNIVSQKLVALTFDDGPSLYTDDILKILEENNSKATFFITGNNIIGNEDIIRRIQNNKNQIGIHGYTHIPFTDMELEDMNVEIATTASMLFDISVNPSRLVRPPFGKLNESIKENVRSPFILWNIDPEDWKYQDKEHIKNVIRKNVSDGSIIVLHDIYKSTVEAVREIIPELQKDGYIFTTIDEINLKYDVKFIPGRVYTKVKN